MKTKSGRWKWVRDHGRIVERDSGGNPKRAVGILLDIDARKKIEGELLIKNYGIESSLDGIVILSLKGKITYVNNSFLVIWGYKDKNEVLGRDESKIFNFRERVTDLVNKNGYWIGEARAKRKDRTPFRVQMSLNIVKNDFGESVCIMGSFNDITDRRRAEIRLKKYHKHLEDVVDQATRDLSNANKKLMEKKDLLEESNKRLKELDRIKSEFVSIVSHELRTPLTGIIGFARTILRLNLPDEVRRKYLTIIESEGKRLALLVDAFLDISRIEAGVIVLEKSKTNISDLLKDSVETLEIPEGINIHLDVPSNLPEVDVDSSWIKQITMNILSNAVKYTKSGKNIRVVARDRKKHLRINIEDEGIGIAPDELDKIFDKFYRCHDSITKKTRGSGLGLSVVKGIVELHGGKIWAESELEKGTKINFTLPKEVSRKNG
jgi:PAS domain S-box-containing protein